MSATLTSGKHKGRTLAELVRLGEVAYLFSLIGRPRLCACHPAVYREAWTLVGDYVKSGGPVPTAWRDARGIDRFNSDLCTPGVPPPPGPIGHWQIALVEAFDRMCARRGKIVVSREALLVEATGPERGGRRRDNFARALRALCHRRVLEMDGNMVFRVVYETPAPCDDGSDLV